MDEKRNYQYAREAALLENALAMQFQAEAKRYCELIEDAESCETTAFIADVAAALADVIAAAGDLPEIAPDSSGVPDGPNAEEWKSRFAAVSRILSDANTYWTTPAPFGHQAADAVELPLADDLADIWRDLKAGLMGLEQGRSADDVVWEWRFGFYTHWGRHATEALRALHALLAESGGPISTDAR